MANLSNINNKFIVADVATATRVSIGITTTNNLLTLFGTGAGNATLQIEGEGGADPYINFLANNAQHWSLGIDDSDSDKFKLSEHSALGTNDYFVVDTSGDVGIGNNNPTAKLTIDNSIATSYTTTSYAGTPANSMLYLNNTNGGSNTASLINFRTGSGDGVLGFVAGVGVNDADFVIQTDGGVNGIERFRITNSGNSTFTGNVNAPELRLQASGTTYLNIGNNTTGSASTDGASIGYFTGQSSLQIVQRENDAMVFSTNATERMRISSDGILKFPNTAQTRKIQLWSSQDNDYEFYGFGVEGSTLVYSVYTTGDSHVFFSGTNSSTRNELMRIKGNGNVGIGRTAPDYKLVISNNNAEGIEFGPGYTSGSNLWQNYNRTTSTYVKETHYGSEYHFMPAGGATGNVGINTTSPSAKLDVQSSGSWGAYGRGSSGDINVENTNTSVNEGGWIGIAGYTGNTANNGFFPMAGITAKKNTGSGDGNYGGDLSFWTTAGTGQSPEANSGMYQRMTINRFGNVGIGTTLPDAKLHIYGSASLSEMYLGEDAAADKAGILKYTQGDGSGTGVITLSHWGNNSLTEGLAVKYGGNVGIGTTSPEFKLDVKSNSDTAPSAYLRGGKSSQGEIQNTGLIIGTQTTMVAGDYQGISFTGYTSSSAIRRGRAAIGVEAINGPGKMDLVFMTKFADDGTQLTSADEKMRITSRGDVGIGTSAPDQTGYGYKTLTIIGGTNHGDSGVIELLSPSVSAEDQNMGIVSFGAGSTRTAMISANRQNANNASSLRFWTSAGSGILERMRIETDGTVRVKTGSVLVETSGQGIFLGGTAATNRLDYYEEGNWTPTIAHNNGTGAVPLTVSHARYIRVGQLVYISAYLTGINPNGNAGGSGPYYGVRNFPFQPENYGAWQIAYASSGITAYGGYSSSASLYFMANGTNGQRSQSHVSGAGVNAWGSNLTFMFNCVYNIHG